MVKLLLGLCLYFILLNFIIETQMDKNDRLVIIFYVYFFFFFMSNVRKLILYYQISLDFLIVIKDVGIIAVFL